MTTEALQHDADIAVWHTGRMEREPDRYRPDWGVLIGIALTFFAIGVTVNVLVYDRVGSAVKTIAAAGIVLSATSELAYIAVRDVGGSVVAALIAGWVVASRFGLLAAGLGARINVGRVHRGLAALNALDPNVGVAIQQPEPSQVIRAYWWVTGALHLGWWVGTFAGVFLGNFIGDADRLGLDAVFPALLLAIIANLLRQRPGFVAALVGGVVCASLMPFAPAGVPIILSLLGAVVALRVNDTHQTQVGKAS